MPTKSKPWPVNSRDCAEKMERLAGQAQTLIHQAAIAASETGKKEIVEAILNAQVPISDIQLALNALLSNDVDRAKKHLGL